MCFYLEVRGFKPRPLRCFLRQGTLLHYVSLQPRAQLFKGQLTLNLGLNLTRVSFFSCSKVFFSDNFLCLELPIINLQTKRIKTEMLFKLSNLNQNLAPALGYLNPALNNSAQGRVVQSWVKITQG